jgi:hypothetical protein
MDPIMEGILSCSLASSRGHPPIELPLQYNNSLIFFRNLLGDGHKKILLFTLVARKIFVIIFITKAFELAFNHFSPG